MCVYPTYPPDFFDICVVILNYNGGSFVTDVVRAALASTSVRLGIVIVDNASTDGSLDRIEQLLSGEVLHPIHRVAFLRTGKNLGYAKGNNLGFFVFPARYIVLLNNDALVTPTTFSQLVAFMDTTPRAGACGPRLNWPDGQAQPFSYGGDPTPLYLMRRALAQRRGAHLHKWDRAEPCCVDWVAGTCLCIRREAIAEIGMLDEHIFMYFEDIDFCLRLRQRGWDVYFYPVVSVTHYNKPSYGDRTRRVHYYNGLERFYTRHYGKLASLLIRFGAQIRLLRSKSV